MARGLVLWAWAGFLLSLQRTDWDATDGGPAYRTAWRPRRTWLLTSLRLTLEGHCYLQKPEQQQPRESAGSVVCVWGEGHGTLYAAHLSVGAERSEVLDSQC